MLERGHQVFAGEFFRRLDFDGMQHEKIRRCGFLYGAEREVDNAAIELREEKFLALHLFDVTSAQLLDLAWRHFEPLFVREF
jgi:hypothetical protein